MRVDALSKNPGRFDSYNYALSGVGGTAHLVLELFMAQSGTRLDPIVYSGAPVVITAIIRGDVHVAPAVNTVGQVNAA